MRHVLASVLAAVLITTSLRANVLLDRALELAAEIQPVVAPTCATVAEAAVQDASRPLTRVKWFVGGLFLPMIFVPVAYLPGPSPPEESLAPRLRACYADAYRQEVQRRRRLGAWSGAIGFGMLAVIVATGGEQLRTTLGE